MKYFDHTHNRLVFEEQRATADFWDKLWEDSDLKKSILQGKNDWFVSRITKRFIRPDKSKKIIEGGCGKGIYVYSLKCAGYDAYGVDFAKKTVRKINELMPQLKITEGDVKKFEFPDNFFDGYWSLGVIEHFYEGYEEVLAEMKRVLKKGGYLFITFPCLCPLRKIKKLFSAYRKFEEKSFNAENFYQFALDPKDVINKIENSNFKLIHKRPLDGLKGLKDEVPGFRIIFQKIYNAKNLLVRIIRIIISEILAPFSHHSILLVFKKND